MLDNEEENQLHMFDESKTLMKQRTDRMETWTIVKGTQIALKWPPHPTHLPWILKIAKLMELFFAIFFFQSEIFNLG